jgi:LEA14-like dessication related protein
METVALPKRRLNWGNWMSLSLRRAAVLAVAVAAPACATTKPPTMQVEKLRIDKLRVTGAGLEVAFRLRNPNPEPLFIERFEYELFLNGHRLGRGYYPDKVDLGGFRDERVVSRFDLNFLSLPGVVKELLDDKRADARVKGDFYVRRGDGSRKMGFSHNATIDLER